MGAMINSFILESGFANMGIKSIIMILIACVFLYLAIKKGYEPYLLIPISVGMLLANMPGADLMKAPTDGELGGLLYYLYQGVHLGIFPPVIFLCIGASTDFGPMIANPKTMLLGAAAQFGILGGADGPTATLLTSKLAPHMLGTIALAAYSYMALVPVIQPPIIRALTTKEERAIKMEQLRPVSKTEKIVFPIVSMIIVIGLLPTAAPLIGMLMLGNLLKESGVVPKLVETAQNPLMYIITIFLGLTVGATANAETFLTLQTLGVTAMGLVAFSVGTASGVLFGKLMCKATGGKVNPMIGAAGVSAVPMAARVVQKVGQEENPSNFLLMHAMGPNVSGVIGSAVVAGILLKFFM